MCSLSTKENRNDKVMPENVLRPLPVKHDVNNRVVSCKSSVDSEVIWKIMKAIGFLYHSFFCDKNH